MKGRQPCRLAVAALLALAMATGVRANAPAEQVETLVGSGPSVGIVLDDPATFDTADGMETSRPFFARIVAPWSRVERESGIYDWSWLAPAVERLADAGYRPVLCLTGSNPLYLSGDALPSPLEGESLRGWIAFLRNAVQRFGDRVRVFEIWDAPDRAGDAAAAYDPEVYAFLLKTSSIAISAEAATLGVEVAVAQGSFDAANLDWQRRVWEGDTSPYVDVLPVRFEAAVSPGEVTGAFSDVLAEIVQHPPAPSVWAHLERPADAEDSGALQNAAAALSRSAAVALIEPATDPRTRDEQVRWSKNVHRTLDEGYAPAPTGDLDVLDGSGRPLPGANALGRFFREEDFSTVVICDLSGTGAAPDGSGRLVIDSRNVKDPRVFDPVGGRSSRSSVSRVDGDVRRRALRVPALPYPVLAIFRKAVGDLPGVPPEELEVKRERGLTAEEIIARYREVQEIQDDRLDRWIARGRVDFHFKLAQGGGSFDLSIESTYFWERGRQLEWEETAYYLNGNWIRWKKIPEFPLIQPEKVITLPLDLTLDRTYVFRLEREDTVRGRPAYVLSFEPTEPNADRSLYHGRIWIDQETFVRLRTNLIQTNLEPPVLSNEERDDFEPILGADGREYWLTTAIDGQQIWTAAGRNFVVQRDVVFDDFRINLPFDEFDALRQQAYTSEHRMMRETEQGYRYLERQDDGTRTVKWKIDTSQLFLAFGAFKDNSIDSVVPLAGVNYFNYDLWGKNIQTNLFFAGVFGFFNFTKPDLFEGRMDAAVEAALSALKRADRVFLGDDEVVAERVKVLSQSVSGRLGFPLGQFSKVNLIGNVTLNQYSEDDDALAALDDLDLGFVLPEDHTVASLGIEAEFNRRGYSLTGGGSWSRRSDWQPWGLIDPATGEFVASEYDPSHDSFARWRINAFKEWYLPKFQKIRGEINYLDGVDLDRFSRYRFSYFGNTRLNGFSGTGVRFDRGAIARAGYAFNLLDVIRFDATIETAQVIDRTTIDETQRFTGVGLSGNIVGPWKTIISLGYGRAVQSDIKDLEGSDEFLLLILKLFK